MKKSNGVTLISLVITIIVLIILASISVYSGKNTIKSSKFTKFKTELEIMQSQVNMLNEKYKKKIEELPEGAHFNEIGEEISLVSNVDEIFTEVGENDKSGYRYYDKITLKDLEDTICKLKIHLSAFSSPRFPKNAKRWSGRVRQTSYQYPSAGCWSYDG